MKPIFFKTAAEFRRWLKQHHATATELWVGFYKKGSGRPSITYPEALDEALCVGWIDGIRKSVGPDAYVNRFTPRRPLSNWSLINIRRAKELIESGRMLSAGKRAFEARDEKRSGAYSFEQRREAAFDAEAEKRLRASPKAWQFFQSQPPGYRRIATFWVISAKKEETRARRLETLIADSAAGRRIGLLRRDQPDSER